MLYFSELKGKQVITDTGVKIGKLTDLVFLAADQPIITKIVVDTPRGEPLTIPSSHIKTLIPPITVTSDITEDSLSQNELYITKNLLDHQIIDITGNKVVRVNDVVIQERPTLLIAGVDIGFLGILRWFGIDETVGKILRNLGIVVTSRFLSWTDFQPLELTRGKVVLKKEQHKLDNLMPEDLADHLEQMTAENVLHVLSLLPEDRAAHVIENLNITFQSSLFAKFTAKRSAKILTRIDPDEAVDILLTLTETKRGQILLLLPEEKQIELNRLLTLSTTPIGNLITSEYLTVSPEDTVRKVLTKIKDQTRHFSALSYVYVLNKAGQLTGVVNLHELLLQPSDTLLYRFMTPSVVVIHLETPVEIAVKKMLKYKVEALPVIDSKKMIIGIVTFDDLAETLLKKL
ncbi:CBS domain-containing protein [Candidatus Gottesmanbacteria bacterium]|nr:CBS domain-containing protein [Candidatus Gottesmanbacteria bacterium]